jgi:hypothetical protein
MIKRLVGTGYCSCVHGIAIWIKKQAEFGTLRASTLRQYKAAMIHYLQGVDGEEVGNALDVLKEIKNIPRRVNGTLLPKRTSAKKLKHISLQDEHKFLHEWLPSRKSKSAQMLRIWL